MTADAAGRFAALLGATTSAGVPVELFASGESRWLGVQANVPGEREQPRVLLVSVPYALKAADAETLGGLPAAAFVRAIHAAPGLLSSTRGAAGKGELPGAALSDEPLTAAAAGDTGHLVKFTDDLGNMGRARLFESVTGNVGIGTTSPSSRLDIWTEAIGPDFTGFPAFSFRHGTFGDNTFGTLFNPAVTADTVGRVSTYSTTGFVFSGFGNADGTFPPLTLLGYATTGSPAAPGVLITGFKPNGANNRQDMSGTNKVLLVQTGLDPTWNTGILTALANGNVGVGTVSPGFKLDVQSGQINASGGLCIAGACNSSGPVGDITGVTAGSGLSGGGTSGDVALAVDTTVIQNRVTGTCTAGEAIRMVNSNGTVTCEAVGGGGDITAVIAGTGLTGGAMIGDAPLAMSAAALTRNITYLAGCDTCSVLVDGDDQRTIYVNLIGAMTINSVTCFSDAGTPSINLQRDDGSAANILTSDLPCEADSDGATSTSIAGSEATLNLNNKLDFVMVNAGGVAKRVTVIVKAALQ